MSTDAKHWFKANWNAIYILSLNLFVRFSRQIIGDPCTSSTQSIIVDIGRRIAVGKGKQMTNAPVQFEEEPLLNMFQSQNKVKQRHSVYVCGVGARKVKMPLFRLICRDWTHYE
eukprot:136534_1